MLDIKVKVVLMVFDRDYFVSKNQTSLFKLFINNKTINYYSKLTGKFNQSLNSEANHSSSDSEAIAPPS